MYRILYNADITAAFNGQTWYKVHGLYKGNYAHANSYEITESQYNDWQFAINDFYYINANNINLGSAYLKQADIAAFRTELHKMDLVTAMSRIWAKAQVYSDLGWDNSDLEAAYANLISESQNIN